MADAPHEPERQINIHFDPQHMGGVYANFANVSHSDYEFTITFARVDHEVEEGDIPGIVVSRVNLSPRFMHELIDAMSRAMAELKPAYREVLQLRFIDGLTAEQTGRRMGRSEGAVMMLTSRALQHLAALVGDPASLPGVRA